MMRDPSEIKHVCIHGHFYQPPRENPWLEEIEREDSAAPHHDWNERINAECYRANAAARVVDEKNRILNLYNNYGRLHFNFGPTLLNWLENHDPWVYRTISTPTRKCGTVRRTGMPSPEHTTSHAPGIVATSSPRFCGEFATSAGASAAVRRECGCRKRRLTARLWQ